MGDKIKELQTILLFSQFAIAEANEQFHIINSPVRLKLPTESDAILITLDNTTCISHSLIELNEQGKAIVDKAFRKYGLIPLIYKGSIGVEVDAV